MNSYIVSFHDLTFRPKINIRNLYEPNQDNCILLKLLEWVTAIASTFGSLVLATSGQFTYAAMPPSVFLMVLSEANRRFELLQKPNKCY